MTKTNLLIVGVLVGQLACSSSNNNNAAVANAADAVANVVAAAKNATSAQIDSAVASVNTVSASGWVRGSTEAAAISQSLSALQADLNALPSSGATSLSSMLQGTTYPSAIKADLAALTTAYFDKMPAIKSASWTQINLNIPEFAAVSATISNPPALTSAAAPAYYCARTIVERLAIASTLQIATTTAAAATAQLNTALCLAP